MGRRTMGEMELVVDLDDLATRGQEGRCRFVPWKLWWKVVKRPPANSTNPVRNSHLLRAADRYA
jgi:hypothetical protein